VNENQKLMPSGTNTNSAKNTKFGSSKDIRHAALADQALDGAHRRRARVSKTFGVLPLLLAGNVSQGNCFAYPCGRDAHWASNRGPQTAAFAASSIANILGHSRGVLLTRKG
jgi:hypothetical protein